MPLACLFFVSALLAQSPQSFVLNTENDVWDVAVSDLNGNEHQDLLLLTSDPDSYPLKKSVAVFLAMENGGYPEAPSVRLPLDPDSGVLFLAECDGTPPQELIVANADGAQVYGWKGADFIGEAAPRFPSLLPSGSKEPIFMRNVVKDLNEDGIDEWVLPTPAGVTLRTADRELAAVECDVVSEIRRGENIYISHRLPAIHFFEPQEKAPLGLAFLSDEFADFAYGEHWQEKSRFRIPLNLEEKWEASAKMADINQDGFPDLMVTQTKGTINLEVLSQIYIASAPFTYEKKATATFMNKGSISSPALKDIDGDGDLDVLIINIPFGVKNFVNYFLRKKLSVKAEVYLFDGQAFPETPSFETSLTMDAPEGREQVAYAMGDFDGDKRLDVCFGKEDEVLAVHRGEVDSVVSKKPWQQVNVPSFGLAKPFNLNGNDRDDIVLYHPGGKNAKRTDVILF